MAPIRLQVMVYGHWMPRTAVNTAHVGAARHALQQACTVLVPSVLNAGPCGWGAVVVKGGCVRRPPTTERAAGWGSVLADTASWTCCG